MIPTFRPWKHTSDDSYIYQLSLVVATATVSYMYASVVNDIVQHAAHHVSYDNQGTYRFFLGRGQSPQLAVELDHWCGVENLSSAQKEWSDHVVFMVRHP